MTCIAAARNLRAVTKVWEQRWHPLRAEWVIVAAHRQDRLAVLLLDEALHESAFLTARDLADA